MTAIEGAARAQAPAISNSVLLGAAMAVLFSEQAVLVLIYGTVGVSGNSAFTGFFLVTCEMTIFFMAMRRIELLLADHLFGFFVLCAAASFAINGRTADLKETALFVVTIAAYASCRCISPSSLIALKPNFTALSAVIVGVGSLATLYAIIDQWPVERGKPIVLGSDAAGTHFAMALALCLVAVTTSPMTLKRSAVVSAALFLPTAILAAATVRFSLMATVSALCLVAVLSRGRQRTCVLIIIAATLGAASVGLASRMDMSKRMMLLATEQTAPSNVTKQNADETRPEVRPPSCTLNVNGNNSVAIRKAVLLDGLYLLPGAGMFGLGLDGFLRFTCVSGTQIHISILQAAVEFGWIAGAAWLLLIGAAAIPLIRLSKQSFSARFALCFLTYCVLITFAHGRTSRDLLLFAALGLAAAVQNRASVSIHCAS